MELLCVQVGFCLFCSVCCPFLVKWLCVHPLTSWYGVHAHTECVVSSVTFVTEHHLVLMVGLLAHGAGLTLHTLPAVSLDHTHQLLAHVQAGRVS